jgi:ABC-2 type transport system ATP-binding protein
MGSAPGHSGYKIEVQNLTKRYPPMRKGTVGFRDIIDTIKGRREEVLALEKISFNVQKGEWFGLLGPNGSGKTTFCDILLDITTPSSGHIMLDGVDVNRDHDRIRGKISEMEYWSFYSRVNVRDTLRRAGAEWMLTKEQTEERMNWLVDLFELREKMDDWVIRLSTGMMIKVKMIATLMAGAPVYVFDEPTPWMDIFTKRKLYAQLKEHKEKTRATIIWTTHNLHEAEQTCDRIAVLNNHLVTVTTPKRLIADMEKANLEEAFVALLKEEEKQTPPAAPPPGMG